MAMNPLQTHLKHLPLTTPLLTASGTSGTTDEISGLAGAARIVGALGAFTTKGVTLQPRTGNPEVRVIETRTGLLNSIGLQNSGVEAFMRDELPALLGYRLPILVNISAGSVDEFAALAERIGELDMHGLLAGLEINVSCPNIAAGGAAFGADPALVRTVVETVRRHARPDLLTVTKLSPNVTRIVDPAQAAIDGGTDVLSMINTLRGTAIDVDSGRFALGNRVGGLSGPAIKPVGLQKVSECFAAIPECRDGRVPIIGMGGIASGRDALEYIMAGATAVAVGTAWFVDPDIFPRIRDSLQRFCRRHDTTLAALRGCVHEEAGPFRNRA